MTIYKYIGDGAGIPGLPHQVTDADIAAFDPEQVKAWQAALESKQYAAQNESVGAGSSRPDNAGSARPASRTTKKAEPLTAEGE